MLKELTQIMGSKWSVRSYKRSIFEKTGNENRKKGNKNFAELFTLRNFLNFPLYLVLILHNLTFFCQVICTNV